MSEEKEVVHHHHHHHHDSSESSSSSHHHHHHSSSDEKDSKKSEHHHHHHSRSHRRLFSFSHIISFCLALNILYVLAEGGIGWSQRSLGLLADAGYNLGDIFGLLFAYYAYKLTGKWEDSKKKDGYQQGMHKAAIANAVILLVTVGAVVVEAIHRYQYPSSMSGKVILITALIGVLVNGLTAFLLMRYKKKDQHVKGAYWYMVADTLISALVAVIGLVIIIKPTLTFIDPVLGIILAIFILVATIRLLHNNLKLVHDGYPSGVTKDDVELVIGNHKNVASVHRVHVWALNAHEYSMTAHFSLHDIAKLEETKKEVKDSLKNRLAIDHVTLELDAPEDWKKEDSNDKQ